jgi:hypothetical protein
MENQKMAFPRKFPRVLGARYQAKVSNYHLQFAKFAPLAIFALFLVTNLTGLFFSPVMAPVATAQISRRRKARR